MFTTEDKELLAFKGISEEQIIQQLACFKNGFPYLKLAGAASLDNGGIMKPSPVEVEQYIQIWKSYKAEDKIVVKFVPASGAASRMFKDLFEFLDAPYDTPTKEFEKKFFEHLRGFAFYGDLNIKCVENEGRSIEFLIEEKKYKEIVANLLLPKGLNYGSLPKGLLKFHKYADAKNRTPLEEHLVEGALYAASDKRREVNIHFTVSSEHRDLFQDLINEKVQQYAEQFGVDYKISFSEQKPSTDTIAVDMNNEPFRERGRLLFRPGGHGALIQNLNELDADVIFIKNIDNVVPDRLKEPTIANKQLIAGVLVSLQKKAFEYLELLDGGKYTHEQLKEIIRFVQQDLCCRCEDIKNFEDTDLVIYLRKKLNRPMRVCGMVKNVGEPGGGPFLAYNSDGTISLQILESSQIDMKDPEKKAMFEQGTHFNPVDLVCAVKDYKGNKFELPKYVDPQTGFISFKSKNGKELKALELPGLWNGAMSDWNTIFVEVPLATFNPVKTVNDLLRDEHQA